MANTFKDLITAYQDKKEEGRSAAIQAARDYYYRGPIADQIVDFSEENGGYLTKEDFENFEAEIVKPLSINWNDDLEVFQNPPNSQGITMLLALNILKDYDFEELSPDDPDLVHLQAEAIKLAFSDRYHHIGDPERVEIPIEELLSANHTENQQNRIDMDQAMEWPIADGLNSSDSHTTTFHITDRYGNGAAVTTSLGAEFMVVDDTGIHINNRMRMMSMEDGNPNELTAGYKVRHTSNPYMALKDGKPYILGGNTGVDTQPQGQMQQFLHVAEFGLSAQEAIDRPRIVSTAFPAGTPPYETANTLQMESDFSDDLINDLENRGHNIKLDQGVFGTANMLVLKEEENDVERGVESRSQQAIGKKKLFR